MYCKNCGKEIPDDSKFCQHCGSSQTKQENYTNFLSKFYKKYKKYIGIYAIWVVINIILYCYGVGGEGRFFWRINSFYPLTTSEYGGYFFPSDHYFDSRYYDITELLFYCVLLPLVLIYGIKFYKKWTEKQINRK